MGLWCSSLCLLSRVRLRSSGAQTPLKGFNPDMWSGFAVPETGLRSVAGAFARAPLSPVDYVVVSSANSTDTSKLAFLNARLSRRNSSRTSSSSFRTVRNGISGS